MARQGFRPMPAACAFVERYRYGIELDVYRAEQARFVTTETIQGDCFDVQCAVESFSLVYLNPPYGHETGTKSLRWRAAVPNRCSWSTVAAG
jgi:16S rRNA G966 N2-methylase RsmD